MNQKFLLNTTQKQLTLAEYKKRISRGGGPIPHNDPPDFKPFKDNRYMPYGWHHMWIQTGIHKEYIVNIKHLHVRGINGGLMNVFKVFVVGVYLPWVTVCCLRCYSQGTRDYYRKELNLCYGPHAVHGNVVQLNDNIKKWTNERKDFLDRRSDEFYHTSNPCSVDKTRPTIYDDLINRSKPNYFN
jgi:hypothetical protein